MHREARFGGPLDEFRDGLAGWGERGLLVVLLAQQADDSVQPVGGVGGGGAQVGGGVTVLVGEAGGDLEGSRRAAR